VPAVLKSGSLILLENSRPVQACNGIALPIYIYIYRVYIQDLELRKKLVKCYIWSIALYSAETWTLRAVDQKHLESFEM